MYTSTANRRGPRHTSYTIKCGVHSNEQINPPYCCTVQSNWKCPQETIFARILLACAREATYRRRWLIAIENSATAFSSDSMCQRAVQPWDSAHPSLYCSHFLSLSPFLFSFWLFLSLLPNINLTGAVHACCWCLTVSISIGYDVPAIST